MGFIAFVFFAFGAVGLWLGWKDRQAKLLARHQPSLPGSIIEAKRMMHESDTRHTSSARSRQHELHLKVDVPPYGQFTHYSSYLTAAEADEMAAKYAVGTELQVKLNLINQREVFLEGEEGDINPTFLVVGAGFVGIAAFLGFQAWTS